MSKVILDASALLALIKNEPGADKVEEMLDNIVMSSINVSEVATILLASPMSLEECEESIFPFISQLISFDSKLAMLTAQLRHSTKHKGLSLGDRACLALGLQMQLPIYTADRIWAELSIENIDIKLIR